MSEEPIKVIGTKQGWIDTMRPGTFIETFIRDRLFLNDGFDVNAGGMAAYMWRK